MTIHKRKKPNFAFILAAGKGTRLRPHTEHTPKPMVLVNGKPILDYSLDKLEKVGVQNVTVNLNYLGHTIEDYLKETYVSPNNIF